MTAPVDYLDPRSSALTPMSPRYRTAEQVSALGWAGLPLVGAVIAALFVGWWMWLVVAALAVALVVVLWIATRRADAHRYAELGDDLVVARGILWRGVTVVPYGRIQFVDLEEGPFLRLFGLATLKLHTASATSDAQIHGLTRDDAQALRARLSEAARVRMEGL
ncbi:MAG: PH domain-containing protein [Gordonia sp. (in: high G+C Gram-positive bacteria)]|uniref:PH domain-containing protein n=1 Tax=Gordonia sp. (in: high G+C Gram-positive bacteria) TaxID=84139 RepID=UPI0039E5B334